MKVTLGLGRRPKEGLRQNQKHQRPHSHHFDHPLAVHHTSRIRQRIHRFHDHNIGKATSIVRPPGFPTYAGKLKIKCALDLLGSLLLDAFG